MLSARFGYVVRVSRKQPSATTEDTTMLAATRYRTLERLPPIVRAVLDARDEAAVIFGARGDVLYVNQAAQATLPPATITPSIDSGLVRAVLGARGGDVVPLHADAQVLGEMIVVPQPNGGTLAERGRSAFHDTLRHTAALAQTAAAPARPPAGPTGTTAAWTLKLTGDVRWQQVTPAGALLVSTDAALAGVDIDRGQVMWEKADLGGLPTDSVRLVEGSLLVEAARPGLLVILDPVTGAVLFDSRRPGLTQIVTRRVLPQSGTLLVHGRRANGPAVVALYDLVTGEQRWVNEGLFEQTEPKKKGLGGLMQGLVRATTAGP